MGLTSFWWRGSVFLWVGVTVGNGERVGFVISGFARVGSSSLVI